MNCGTIGVFGPAKGIEGDRKPLLKTTPASSASKVKQVTDFFIGVNMLKAICCSLGDNVAVIRNKLDGYYAM